MRVQVRLHGILRDKLPAEMKGRTAVDLADDARLQDLLDTLGVKRRLQTAVNDHLINDRQTPLQDGDTVEIFRAAAGGC
ncbi:MAG: MoaD/ThiS family protein [Chloroflexi bacterium]|nr:MoaD/ThiS family protein [Chloroflexota bacterium]